MSKKKNKSDTSIKPGWYCRKSSETEDRQIASIDSQRDEMLGLAKRDSLVVPVECQFEESHSAKYPDKRPKFKEVLKMIEAGKVNTLFVWSPNRLSRNAIDTARIIDLMDRGLLFEVRTPGKTFNNEPVEKLLLTLFCSVSKMENDEKGIDVKRGLLKKASGGEYPAPAPIGYKNIGELKGKKKMTIDPENFPIVRRMWDLLLSGKHTPPHILKIATDDWKLRTRRGKKLSRSNVYHLFGNTFYYGEYEYPGGSANWYKGNHKPMITKDEYERAQFIIHGKNRPRPKKHTFTYRGFMTCGSCGAAITTDPPKYKKLAGGGVASYIYYHCTRRKDPNCTQGSIEERELEKQIAVALEELKMPDELVDWSIDTLRDLEKHSESGQKVISTRLKKDLDECLQMLDGLTDMRARQEITAEVFKSKRDKLEEDKKRLESELGAPNEEGIEDWLKVAQKGFQFAVGASVAFSSTDTKDIGGIRREIFSTLGSNHNVLDKNLIVKADILLVPIGELAKAYTGFFEGFEPTKNGSNKRYLVDDDPQTKTMLNSTI